MFFFLITSNCHSVVSRKNEIWKHYYAGTLCELCVYCIWMRNSFFSSKMVLLYNCIESNQLLDFLCAVVSCITSQSSSSSYKSWKHLHGVVIYLHSDNIYSHWHFSCFPIFFRQLDCCMTLTKLILDFFLYYFFRNLVNTAANFYKATLSVTTGLSAPYSNLATIYKQQVNLGQAGVQKLFHKLYMFCMF